MGKIKELPTYERPREKALRNGVDSLSDNELLAIIIGSGVKNISALEIAMNLTMSLHGLKSIFNTSFYELSKFKGISKAKALEIITIKELFNRYIACDLQSKNNLVFNNSNDVYRYLSIKMDNLINEQEIVLFLNNRNALIHEEIISIGNDVLAVNNNKYICKMALEKYACKIIVAHNHPSNVASPSMSDKISYNNLKSALSYVNVKLVDHLIITNNGFYSFNENIKDNDLLNAF